MKPHDPYPPRTTRTQSRKAKMVPSEDQCRCSCGSMLARIVREGLELKCRKCKSLVLITHDELVEMYRALDFELPPILNLRDLRPR